MLLKITNIICGGKPFVSNYVFRELSQKDVIEFFACCFPRFITGFVLGAVPWYIGAFLLFCVRMDYREKPGLIACTLGVSFFLLMKLFVSLLREPYRTW